MAGCDVYLALSSQLPFHKNTIFAFELSGIYVFATYWVVKTYKSSRMKVDVRAAKGKLQMPAQKFPDVFRETPVTPKEGPKDEP